MRSMLILLCVVGLFVCAAAVFAGPGKQQAQSGEYTFKINYLLYQPADYEADKDKKWPVLIFLHGSGERGDDLERVKIHGPPMQVSKGKELPFIVVSPQCPQRQYWDAQLLSKMLDEVIAKNRVDESRIYLTGLSMGGFGTWDWASREPKRFAAIVPICGGGNTLFARRIKDIPTWVFHGAKDTSVPLSESEQMVEAMKKAGGNPKFTVYPDLEHDSWTRTYDNPELYQWLLEQKRPAEDAKSKDSK